MIDGKERRKREDIGEDSTGGMTRRSRRKKKEQKAERELGTLSLKLESNHPS